MTSLLSVEGLSVRYGGVTALDRVDLEVGPGRLVGLIGPNGAGKTTFIDAVTGFTRSDGAISLAGRRIDGLPPHRRARLGLVRTWQTAEVYDQLTVRENLAVAAGRPKGREAIRELWTGRSRIPAVVDETLDLLGIADLADASADELSQGQRKLVDVARAVAARPRVLCLDEPAAGLDTAESAELGHCLRRLVDAGIALLLVDHDMGLVLGVCAHVYVLDFGRVIANDAPEAVRTDPLVLQAYLGEQEDEEHAGGDEGGDHEDGASLEGDVGREERAGREEDARHEEHAAVEHSGGAR